MCRLDCVEFNYTSVSQTDTLSFVTTPHAAPIRCADVLRKCASVSLHIRYENLGYKQAKKAAEQQPVSPVVVFEDFTLSSFDVFLHGWQAFVILCDPCVDFCGC